MLTKSLSSYYIGAETFLLLCRLRDILLIMSTPRHSSYYVGSESFLLLCWRRDIPLIMLTPSLSSYYIDAETLLLLCRRQDISLIILTPRLSSYYVDPERTKTCSLIDQECNWWMEYLIRCYRRHRLYLYHWRTLYRLQRARCRVVRSQISSSWNAICVLWLYIYLRRPYKIQITGCFIVYESDYAMPN